MTTPVTFELAKLLKEKGFEQNHEVGIICRIQNTVNKNYEKTRAIKQSDLDNLWSVFNEVYPTIAEVLMWLYEKHKIWISSEPFIKNDNSVVNIYKIFKEGIIDTISRGSLGYDSPTKAYLAAIDYILNNLI